MEDEERRVGRSEGYGEVEVVTYFVSRFEILGSYKFRSRLEREDGK